MNDERDALQQLLTSPGWKLFETAQSDYWREALLGAIAGAANDRDDLIALQKIRQIIAAQQAMQRALAWPTERLRKITEQDKLAGMASSMARGGFV